MANIPNRPLYGLLGCMKAVVDSRFNGVNNEVKLKDLKHSLDFKINAIDICPESVRFHKIVISKIKREKYCPLLDTNTDTRMCEWVHAIDNDPQKSKPVGQVAIILEALNLAILNHTHSGRVISVKWTKNAETVKKLSWDNPLLNKLLCKLLLEYGPIWGIAYYGSFVALNENFVRNDILQYINIPFSKQMVKINCNCKSNDVILPNGNTSSDAASRSTSALLHLSASAGLVYPDDYNYRINEAKIDDSYPSYYYKWFFKNPKRKSAQKWKINKEYLEKIMRDLKFKRGISYDNLIPKATDRNRTNLCNTCGKNLMNLAKKEYGEIVKNRRYLLFEALRIAFDNNKKISLKKLVDLSKVNDRFAVNKKEHYYGLKLDIQLANLTGFWISIKDDYICPNIGADENAFDPIPKKIRNMAQKIISSKGILL